VSGLSDEAAMRLALEQARDAADAGEIPVGAVLLDADGAVVARDRNRREQANDPTAHAEILVLRAAASSRSDWRLTGCTLVVTLEPCPMCAGAIVMARVPRLVFGAWNDEYGAAGSRWDLVRDRRLPHRVEVVGGVLAEDCRGIVQGFLAAQREEA
jgi:tRNA(adenine34) deaminase